MKGKKRKIVGCIMNIKSHDVSEFYENRLLCEIYLCTCIYLYSHKPQ
jgi:hypothetical protein